MSPSAGVQDLPPAVIPRTQGAGEVRIGANQVAGGAGVRPAGGGEPVESGKIMLGVVDRLGRIRRRRPAEAGGGRRFGAARELGKIGQAPLARPQGLKRVEGRNPRARLVRQIEARVGKTDAAFGGADRQGQRQALAMQPALVGGELAADLRPQCIEQERLLDDLARKHSLGQPGDKDGVEAQPARRFDRTHEHLAVVLQRRRDRPFENQGRKYIDDLSQRNRPDRCGRGQLGERRQHPVGMLERPDGEAAQPFEPLAPVGGRGPAVEQIDQRQGISGEGREIVESAPHARGRGLVFVVEFGQSGAELRGQTGEAPPPAIGRADHRCLDQLLFPAPRRAQLSLGDRGWFPVSGACRNRLGRRALGFFRRLFRHGLRVRRHPSIAARRGGRRRPVGCGVGQLSQ